MDLKGWPCCPQSNPQIRNGHCADRVPMGKAIKFDPEESHELARAECLGCGATARRM